MTPDLETRWRERRPPFDGSTIFVPHREFDLAVPRLRAGLAAVIDELASAVPGPWHEFYDWHQHDGFIENPKPCDLHAVRAACESDAAILASVSSDFLVARAICDDGHRVLLRYWADLYEEPDPTGEFDITGAPDLIERLAVVIERATGMVPQREPAAAFFDSRYSPD